MFNSKITVKALIDGLRSEVDIAVQISDSAYIEWLNALEHLLYTEIIQEQKAYKLENPNQTVSLKDIKVSEEEAPVRFEDIHTIYADKTQLIKSTAASGEIFTGTFYKTDDNIGINLANDIKIVYFVKPALKTVDDGGNAKDSEYVNVPIEFIELVKAKLRAEAYKVANEDDIAAKWMNDYNILLETFKAWIVGKAPQFGM